jgi:hypothetical protein
MLLENKLITKYPSLISRQEIKKREILQSCTEYHSSERQEQ